MTFIETSRAVDEDLANVLPALLVGLDDQGRIVVWNHRLEAATGFSQPEMLGQDGTLLVGTGGDRQLHIKGGGHRLVRWQLSSTPTASGISYALGIDVTDERDLRRTLRSEQIAATETLAADLAHELRNPLNSAALQLNVLSRRVERGQTDREHLMPIIQIVGDELRRLERLTADFLMVLEGQGGACSKTAR